MPNPVLLKKFVQVTCYLSLVTLLSGCTAIGGSKPSALQVTSVPEASIFLDGKHLGKTPFFSDQLKSGEHELKITADNATYVSKISLTPSTLTVINRQLATNFLAQAGENLTLNPGKSGLFIISTPNGATVTIDGKLAGSTPALIPDIKAGEHKVSLSKDNFSSREFSLKTTSNYQLLAEVTLSSEIAKELSSQTTQPKSIQKIEVTGAPKTGLKIMQDPDTTSKQVGTVKNGDDVEVLQQIDNWVKVISEDGQGWIQSRYTKKLP